MTTTTTTTTTTKIQNHHQQQSLPQLPVPLSLSLSLSLCLSLYIPTMQPFTVVQPTLSIVSRKSPFSKFPVHRIYCVGRNYAEHAAEMGEDSSKAPPVFFQKPSCSALVDTSIRQDVKFPPQTTNLHYEAELVVAIGATTTTKEAEPMIFGYAVGCDLTRRDLQGAAKKSGHPWDTAKGFDDSAPCGPIVPREEAALDGASVLSLKTRTATNDFVLKQSSRLDAMIWSVEDVVANLSKYFVLQPGDLIFTGTPAGVGPLQVGDRVKIECEPSSLPACEFTMV